MISSVLANPSGVIAGNTFSAAGLSFAAGRAGRGARGAVVASGAAAGAAAGGVALGAPS